MNCHSCGRAHGPSARFCGGCGKPLAPCCPSCGAESEPDAQFCEACGASLVSLAAAPAEARKVVTIVFADLVGSTALHERLDAESVRRFMDRYYQAMRGAVEAEGGTVTQLLGDGVLAIFGAPRVAEDDAIRAVRAAVGMQQAFRALAAAQSAAVGQTGLRIAVNTGEVVASEQSEIIGDPVNVAARLQEQGRDGDVVIGEATRRLVSALVTLAPLGTFALKGRAETVAAYRVVSLDRPGGAPASAFVGRDEELRRLTAVYEAAVAAPGARLAVILGSPGLGKSRLLAELARRLGSGATIVTARCDATGGATFAPLAEALRTLLDLGDGAGAEAVRAAIDRMAPGDDPERGRIAAGIAALLAGTPAPPEETFFVVRRLLTALAVAQPVVLAIDDLQWAESLLLDLTEHLVQWSTDVPLLVLVAARPELREVRSALAVPGGLVHAVVTLAGLDAGAATRLAANVVGADELPAAIAGRVLATSEGNPLFVGELVRMLVHDGALKREGDRWTTGVELAALEMPPTIHALLAARIERLGPEERTVLERAAVIGRQFSRAAVAQLLPGGVRDLDARLESLRRSELIEPDTGWFLGEPVLRFHHLLIRDAAYRRLLKGTRAELHGRFADWLESRVGEAVEHDETIGWHLEQAHRHLGELGPLADSGRLLGVRAARYLAAAGRRALARDDLPLAGSLLGRALDRLDAADPARAELALDWCEALLAAGDVGPAAGAIAELGRFIAGSERLRAWHTCFIGQHAALTDPQALHVTVDAVAAAADALAAAGDAAGEAKAHFVHAIALSRLGKVGACEAALDRALAAARRGHDRRRANAVLAGAPLAALWGPSAVTRASGRCLDVVRVLRITQGAPAVEAVALRCQAVLEALRGRTEAARRMIASSRHLVEELGITQRLFEADVFAGLIELLEGDAVAAESSLRAAYDGLRGHGLGIDAAQAAALLGRALLAQGRAAEAEALSHESEALAGDDLKAAIAWRGVRAEALAQRGEHLAAVELACAAVDIAAATDALLDHADARLALAAAFRAAGRSDEADAEEARAVELWEAKGATLLAERARRDGGRVAVVSGAPDESAAPVHLVRRRVRANAATAIVARLDAAVAARDVDALGAVFADDSETVHHPTGATYGREGALARSADLLKAEGLTIEHEPLATLGESLALCRASVTASGISRGRFDVGAYETEQIVLIEADSRGQRRRAEFFADDRLGNAVVRLYERYADLLPDGPARARAAATARSIAVLLSPVDPDRQAEAFAPAIEFVDHRHLVGLGSAHGAEAALQGFRTMISLVDDPINRVDDLLGLRADAILMPWTTFGTVRASGGSYERHHLQLWSFGADGLATRVEWFDREDEALARFDELTGEPTGARSGALPARAKKTRERRVRANAATANAGRLDAAVAARDADALGTLFADDAETVHHPTGATYDRWGALARVRSIFEAEDVTFGHEPLATLGDSLALCRMAMAASGISGERFDVGAYESEQIALIETDARGQRRRAEFFADDRLADAVARLYALYADLLPDGPAHDRAAMTARVVAALMIREVPLESGMLAPDFRGVDHRRVGHGGIQGARDAMRVREVWRELGDVRSFHVDDVLALSPDGLVRKTTEFGVWHDGGGAFERTICRLSIFDTAGAMIRSETFEADREDEALARFDALTGEPAAARFAAVPSRAVEKRERRVRANAATANIARLDAAVAARDTDAFGAVFADDAETIHHPTGATYDRRAAVANIISMFRAEDLRFTHEPLATLGDSLALCRMSWSASRVSSGRFDVGPYESEQIALIEVNACGQRRWAEFFRDDQLGAAVVRLYERYADLLPDGPARARAAATARSVATTLGFAGVPPGVDDFRALVAPNVEYADHRTLGFASLRGAEAVLGGLRSLLELADDVSLRVDEVINLRSDALIMRATQAGTVRASGGAYEKQYVVLSVFGTDGLLTRYEDFDADHEAEALARFDQLTAEPSPDRRTRANAATAQMARLDAVIAARDVDALPTLFADVYEIVNHTTGVTYDRQGELSSYRGLMGAREPRLRQEPLATLGDSLALSRVSRSASSFVGRTFDVGAYEVEEIALIEVDAEGRERRAEVFATDRLSDAVVRLYERRAELLPDGPARARAATTARSVAALLGPLDMDRYAVAIASAVEFVDHRPLGLPSGRGAGEQIQMVRSLLDLSDDIVIRTDEVLALRSDALLVRWANFGTMRVGGGAYERHFLMLWIFGADGLVARNEIFAAEHGTEALARFDELTAEPATARREAAPSRAAKKRERRVRPNAATANAARLEAAIAARDLDTIADLHAGGIQLKDHAIGVDNDRQEMLAWWRLFFSDRDPALQLEPVATLGTSLALFRRCWSGSASGDPVFDIGSFEREVFDLNEADAESRVVRVETFATDHLGDAVVRLYERYAELLPDGPTRARAAATARSIAVLLGPLDPDRVAEVLSPGAESEDHRTLIGLGSAHGKEALAQNIRAMAELIKDSSLRIDDLLALQPDGLLTRTTSSGVDRAGGGAFEREFLRLWIFGSDGLLTHTEWFDADRAAEALARFDELTVEPATARFAAVPSRAAEKRERRVRPNAATANAARFDAAIARRDADALPTLMADDVEVVHHPIGVVYDRRGLLVTWRSLLSARDPTSRHEPLATLGDSLALCRTSTAASSFVGGTFDVGAYEIERFYLLQVDANGRQRRGEVFGADRLGDAVARLYERYADLLPDGPARTRAAATARAVAAMVGPYDVDRYATAFTSATEYADHRTWVVGSLTGVQAVRQWFGTLLEVAEDVANRFDDILELRSDALLLRWTQSGTDRIGGGAFERHVLWLGIFGVDALLRRVELFEGDRDTEALARFDELTAEPATTACLENAATRLENRIRDAWNARDWERFTALFSVRFRSIDRRMHLDLDRDALLESVRPFFDAAWKNTNEMLATRGDRLALVRVRLAGVYESSGPSEIEFLQVNEVDENGDHVAAVAFNSDALDAAYAELDARYAAGEAAPFGRAWAVRVAWDSAFASRDWDGLTQLYASDLVVRDHRLLGWETHRGPAAEVQTMRVLVDLAPDVRMRSDHITVSDRAMLIAFTWVGTREGGTFELPIVAVNELDDTGRCRSIDVYDPEQLDVARARFNAIGASVAGDPLAALARPNAASAARERLDAAFAARDWDAMRALCATGAKFEDRRRHVLITYDVEDLIADRRRWASMDARQERRLVGTAGDRVALEHALVTSGPPDGRSEWESLTLTEVDDCGRLVAGIVFDVDDWRAATREAWARWLARDGAAAAVMPPIVEFIESWNDQDRGRLRATLADDVVLHDLRRAGLGLVEGADRYLDSAAALWDLAPDSRMDIPSQLALERYGVVTVVRRFGTLREGGGYESPHVAVVIVSGGRITRFEVFEIEDAVAALARFAELRPDPLRIPPNAATRAIRRLGDALDAQDWDALEALCAPALVHDDRRRHILLTSDRDMFIAGLRFVAPQGGRRTRTLLATAGERLALEHVLWTGAVDAPEMEIELLAVVEVDADGRLVALIHFDPDDRRSASAELFERYARSDEARWIPAAFFELSRAVNDHDLDRLRAVVPPDFVFDDHRRTGLGRLEGAEDYIAAVAALFEQSPDVIIERLYLIAEERHGNFNVSHRFGTLAEGGAFESVFVGLSLYRADRLVGLELFEPEHLDVARARFEELRPPGPDGHPAQRRVARQ